MASILQQRRSMHDELKKLTEQNTNLMLQIDRFQPLLNLGLVSAMIAHEINNILTPIGTYAQLARQNPDDTELTRKVIDKTVSNTERAARILEAMLAMANGQSAPPARHNLKQMTDEIFDCLARDFSKDRINLTIDIPDDLTVTVDRICFQQVLMNLIINARQALLDDSNNNAGGALEISAEQTGATVNIVVSDTAAGISPDNLDKIFDPFFTTKTSDSDNGDRSGTGLGLAFCKRIIDSHNGTIEVDSKPGAGTAFTIKIPDRI